MTLRLAKNMTREAGLIITVDQRSMIGQKLMMIGQHSIHPISLKDNTPINLAKMIIIDLSDRDLDFLIISPVFPKDFVVAYGLLAKNIPQILVPSVCQDWLFW